MSVIDRKVAPCSECYQDRAELQTRHQLWNMAFPPDMRRTGPTGLRDASNSGDRSSYKP